MGWALHQAGLDLLDDRLRELRPAIALECGSGASTAILHARAGHAISLEHLPEWAANTAATLPASLTGELRLCPLTEVDTPLGPLPFYATTLPDQIEFVLIDGPPGAIGRAGTLFALWPHLAPDAVVWLDDVERRGERAALDAWREHLGIKVTRVDDRLAELTRA